VLKISQRPKGESSGLDTAEPAKIVTMINRVINFEVEVEVKLEIILLMMMLLFV